MESRFREEVGRWGHEDCGEGGWVGHEIVADCCYMWRGLGRKEGRCKGCMIRDG